VNLVALRCALGSRARPALHYAARFAAKEALVKALGCGFRNGIEWRDIEVTIDSLGCPALVLTGRAGELCRRRNSRARVSLAHEQEFALAFVVLEKEKG